MFLFLFSRPVSWWSRRSKMYSHKSEYRNRRQYSDRGSRQLDDYDDRWDERREPQREKPQDSHHKYGRDGRRSTERASRISEFSDSPKRSYSNDSNWSRKSPVRRRMSSPVWDGSEQKRQRFADDDDDDYRYVYEPHGRTCRQSTDSGSHAHKEFKNTPPREEDFRYRRSPPDSRHRHRHDDLTYSNKDRDGHKRSRSQEKTRFTLQDRPTKVGYNLKC